jgi:hypothetical protein
MDHHWLRVFLLRFFNESVNVSKTVEHVKLLKLKERLRICKIECHPLTRYSYPGEGATVERSIANYIIIGKYDRMRKGMPNLQSKFTQEDADEYDARRIAKSSQTCRINMRPGQCAKKNVASGGKCLMKESKGLKFEERASRLISALTQGCLGHYENFRAR